ncbi:MAG TPA: hypothetical protein VIG99_08805 [Myxococcaceae bacterium]|jgi:hypothetical protein
MRQIHLALALVTGGAMALSACDCASTGADRRRYPCVTDEECAPGFTCVQGECHRPGDGSDAGHLDFATTAQVVPVGTCSQRVTVEARSGGNDPWVVAADTSVDLTASPSAGFAFFSDPGCTATAPSAVIPLGQSSTGFYFMGTQVGPVTVTVAAPTFGSATQVEGLVANAGNSLAFVTAAQSVAAGACSGAVTVQSRDGTGNPSSPSADLTVTLAASPSNGFQIFSDASCTTQVAAVTILTGTSTQTFYFSGSVVGPVSLSAGATGYTSATQGETVTAGPAAALAFSTPPQALAVATCSSIATVQTQDILGNPSTVGATTAVGLSASPISIFGFYSDPGCTTSISSVTIPAGGSSASFYFMGSTVGSRTVTASSGALTSAIQVESIGAGAPAALAFTTTAQTVTAGNCSGTVSVQSQDGSGNPSSVAGDTAVALSASPSTGFLFYSNASCTSAVSSITIPAGTTTASFFFRGTQVLAATVTAAAGGLSSAFQTETIAAGPPAALVFTTPARTVTAGGCSAAVTVQSQDAAGNPANVSPARTVSLSASPATGFTFYSNSLCTTAVTTVSIASGANSATFYFRGTAAGTPTITGSSGGLSSATQTETINPGAPSVLAFTTAPRTVTAGGCSAAVTVQARDAFANPTNLGADTTVTLTAAPSAGFAFHSNAACTTATGTTTILGGSSTATFYFRGTAAGGVSATAAATGFSNASQSETINPGPPASLEISTAAQTILARACSSVVTLTFRDAFGNAAPVSVATFVPLSSTPAGGPSFFSDSSCANAIGSAPFAASTSASSFYFRGRTGGTFTVTASPGALAPVSQSEVILPTVRRGTCTMFAANTSVNCAISPAQFDLTKTFMMFQAVPGDEADPSTSNVRCKLSSTSNVRCTRDDFNFADVSIAWQTVELPSGITVQHVDASCDGTQTVLSVPIATVASTADTFVLASHEEFGFDQDDDNMATIELTSQTNVDVTVGSGCDWDLSLQVVEIPGISVTTGRVQLAPGDDVGAVTGLPAASAGTVVLHSHQTNSPAGGTCNFAIRGQVDTGTSLRFTRGNGNFGVACYDSNIDVSFQRIDFGPLATIQVPNISMAPASFVVNTTLPTAVDTSRTIVFSGDQAISGQGMGETDYPWDDIIGEAMATHRLTSSTNLRLSRGEADESARFTPFVLQIE